jgi:DNA-binding NarL/FixJ family response regulator
MSAAIRVQVYATDPILHAGAVASLSAAHDLVVLSAGSPDRSAVDVAVVVSDSLDEHTSATLARLHRLTGPRVVLVMDAVDGRAVLAAVEAGTGALVRRSEASGERLTQAVRRVAAGEGMLPGDVLGRLLHNGADSAGRLTFGGLTQRELTVLRLVADGYSTAEIADRLTYSERTIKNALHDLARRFHLRNRTHAVAFAVREGLI